MALYLKGDGLREKSPLSTTAVVQVYIPIPQDQFPRLQLKQSSTENPSQSEALVWGGADNGLQCLVTSMPSTLVQTTNNSTDTIMRISGAVQAIRFPDKFWRLLQGDARRSWRNKASSTGPLDLVCLLVWLVLQRNLTAFFAARIGIRVKEFGTTLRMGVQPRHRNTFQQVSADWSIIHTVYPKYKERYYYPKISQNDRDGEISLKEGAKYAPTEVHHQRHVSKG
ncbi:hypothetical protein ARMGADRAFT_1034937 [Armillaria gallica]|uniref:Uncharacterized protein n=1 Tax=Armillaria gallica TaxID=47427 RepID=A0A2H3DGJ8_ARMGA|nr:hypothetical protein ARMGADRAFT_1034937 [Armillaria gallica]